MHATPRIPTTQRDELVHRRFLAVERADGEYQREHEQTDAVANDVVAQQCRGDDPRRELAAGDLDRHQQRAEREYQERQRQRDDRLVQRGGAGRFEPAQAPTQPRIERAQRGASSSSSAMATQRDRPQRGLEVAGRAVQAAPRQLAANEAPELAPSLGQRRRRCSSFAGRRAHLAVSSVVGTSFGPMRAGRARSLLVTQRHGKEHPRQPMPRQAGREGSISRASRAVAMGHAHAGSVHGQPARLLYACPGEGSAADRQPVLRGRDDRLVLECQGFMKGAANSGIRAALNVAV